VTNQLHWNPLRGGDERCSLRANAVAGSTRLSISEAKDQWSILYLGSLGPIQFGTSVSNSSLTAYLAACPGLAWSPPGWLDLKLHTARLE